MYLTELGAQAATFDAREKRATAKKIIGGESILLYMEGVCYDAVAYTRYLLGAHITAQELTSIWGQDWKGKFHFTNGTLWDGASSIPIGTGIGFYRPLNNSVFHAALGVGGSCIRGINGGLLGTAWELRDLAAILPAPNPDGSFSYDGTSIYVYLSTL